MTAPAKRLTARRVGFAALLALAAACLPAHAQQRSDPDFVVEIERPAYDAGTGPRVVIDEAHNNFHTASGRYAPFAEMLTSDGYRVSGSDAAFTAEALAEVDILVIANALSAENTSRPVLPSHPAFSPDEIAAVRDWVAGGGSLLLIADHMPWAGAAAPLAKAFGFLFADGYAFHPDGRGIMSFEAEGPDGRLVDHPIVGGRASDEAVTSVLTFTGQAFRVHPDVEARRLLVLGDDTLLLLPVQAWRFSEQTPRLDASGLLQAATLEHGAGRVAVFAEAAMFTAQLSNRGDKMGMNHPDAGGNPQFVLNVLRWLSGLL